ncbi:MAG: abortive infection family protein [Euryarchaeota archaeon]|nr:abortive infection family protein [Euryarchaeota archaeon]
MEREEKMSNQSLVELVVQWLKDGDEHEAAEIIEQCLIDTQYVDTALENGGGRTYDLFDVQVAAPRKLLKEKILGQLAPLVKQVESAIRECALADNVFIRNIIWVARTGEAWRNPAGEEITQILSKIDSAHVHSAWEKAVARKSSDPEGAITAARTLIETVCKHILDLSEVEYPKDVDLPKLYRITSEQLSLAPTMNTEPLVRQVLGNCQAVVGGLAAIRNVLGDAHGKSTTDLGPRAIHAELAVNLAGAMSTFLIQNWEVMKEKKVSESDK